MCELTPLPSLRAKAHKVIRKILHYIQPPDLHQLFTYNIMLTPDYKKTGISYVLCTVNPTNYATCCNPFGNISVAY